MPKRHCLVGVSGKIAGWFCFCVLFCPISCCAFLIDLHGKWSNDVHVSCRCAPRASANISTQCAGLHFWSVPTSGQSEVLGTYQMPSVMRGCSGVKQFSTSQESRRACCCDPCFSCALAPNKPYLDCKSVHSLFTLILGFVAVTIAYELANENNAHLWFSREIVVGNDTVDNNTVLLKFLFSG